MTYFEETFTPEEQQILGRYFTNLDRPVFAVVNLPEVVKGALFARYSRTHKSLRRLFIDEFWTQAELGSAEEAEQTFHGSVDQERAHGLYRRVFHEYGDDSVAQLGGAHLACEQASNILTKILEWGRLAAYLEQSTRYIFYDTPLGGRYRYHRPSEIEDDPELFEEYSRVMEQLFGFYSGTVAELDASLREQHPRSPQDSERLWAASIRAQACDLARGLLPASTLSNVGIFGSGQAYEMALVRMQSHQLAEVRDYGQMMLTELRQVIPSFLTRVDLPDRGQVWSDYLADTATGLEEQAQGLGGASPQPRSVTLTDWDPAAEEKLVAAALFPWAEISDRELNERVARMPIQQRQAILRELVGNRTNRRHKPGRAMERPMYRFEIVCDFGSFRDLQRHRLMTLQWQRYSTRLGYELPPQLSSDQQQRWEMGMEAATDLYEKVRGRLGPEVAQYVVPFASLVRFVVDLNARQAFHLIELRSQSSGHPVYRWVAQEMHRQIETVAHHFQIAGAMKFVDQCEPELGRLEEQRRSEQRQQEQATR